MIHLHLEFKSLAEATPVLLALSKNGLVPEESKPGLEMIIDKYNVPSPAEEAINIPTEAEVKTTVDKAVKRRKEKLPELKQEAPESEELNLAEEEEPLFEEPEQIKTDKEGMAITVETLQAKARRLVKKNAANGDRIIALLTKCKVKKIPALNAKYFPAFDNELNKLDK